LTMSRRRFLQGKRIHHKIDRLQELYANAMRFVNDGIILKRPAISHDFNS
jgi:hypothetical protein